MTSIGSTQAREVPGKRSPRAAPRSESGER